MEQVIELLTALSSPEATKRKPAEELFQQGKNQPNPDQLVLSFLQALGSAQIDVALRTQAAVLLRQLVSKTDKALHFPSALPKTRPILVLSCCACSKQRQIKTSEAKLLKSSPDLLTQLVMMTPGVG